MEQEEVRLRLTQDGLGRFCDQLAERTRSPQSALAGLAAIDSLLTHAVHPDDLAREPFEALKHLLAERAEGLREALIEENAERLAAALRAQSAAEVTRLHEALSREGFWNCARRTASGLDPAVWREARAWVTEWCGESRRRAAAASPYPDALNFRKAGIDPARYTAMEELRKALDAPSGTEGFGGEE